MRTHGERVSTSYSWKLLGALPGVETELTRKEGQGMRRPPHRASGFVGQMPRAGSAPDEVQPLGCATRQRNAPGGLAPEGPDVCDWHTPPDLLSYWG